MTSGSERPASDHRVRHAAAELLGRRVVAADALADELRAAGIHLGPDGVDRLGAALDGSSSFIELADGWANVDVHLDGTRWVTTLDPDHAARGELSLDPDLGALGWWLLDETASWRDSGEPIAVVESDEGDDLLVGPHGWLDGCDGADQVEVVVDGTTLSVVAATGVAEPSVELAAAVRSAFDARADVHVLADGLDSEPVELAQMSLEDLLWEVLTTQSELVRARPVPPVEVLLDAAGLLRNGYAVLRADTDMVALRRWRLRQKLASLFHLSDPQVDWVEVALGMSRMVMVGQGDEVAAEAPEGSAALLLATALEDPHVDRAFVGTLTEEGASPDDVLVVAEWIVDQLPTGVGAGARWLEGWALDRLGAARDAMGAYERAVATGDEHALALIELAGLRSDAGDARGAVDLLHRAGIAPDAGEDDVPGADEALQLLDEVEGYAQHRPTATVGRNDRCPCGSGRKYKACHLGNEQLPLIERGPWLYAKQRRYARLRAREFIAQLASAVQSASGRDGLFLLDLLDSPLVHDVALAEGGMGDAFLESRDELLPDDEAMLVARWQLTERSLFEVTEARATALSLRDLRTGEQLTVTNTNAEAQTRRGQLMLGRPLPVDDTWRAFSGFVTVPDSLRDEVLDVLDEADPFGVADVIGRCFAPPRMTNTDGEPLEFHELAWSLPDPDATRAALAAHEALDHDGDVFRMVRDTENQHDTVVFTLALDRDELRSEVNSSRRASEVIEFVASTVTDAELVDHDIRNLDEMADTPGASAKPPRNLLDDSDMIDVRDEIVAQLEQRWLDDQIPALGGRTPREAADDPIGRHELERLLDSLDDSVALMSAARLRAELGL